MQLPMLTPIVRRQRVLTAGEVYVFNVAGGGNLGTVPADTSGTNANLVTTIRGPTGSSANFGQFMSNPKSDHR